MSYNNNAGRGKKNNNNFKNADFKNITNNKRKKRKNRNRRRRRRNQRARTDSPSRHPTYQPLPNPWAHSGASLYQYQMNQLMAMNAWNELNKNNPSMANALLEQHMYQSLQLQHQQIQKSMQHYNHTLYHYNNIQQLNQKVTATKATTSAPTPDPKQSARGTSQQNRGRVMETHADSDRDRSRSRSRDGNKNGLSARNRSESESENDNNDNSELEAENNNVSNAQDVANTVDTDAIENIAPDSNPSGDSSRDSEQSPSNAKKN